jgi:hypothetical protein
VFDPSSSACDFPDQQRYYRQKARSGFVLFVLAIERQPKSLRASLPRHPETQPGYAARKLFLQIAPMLLFELDSRPDLRSHRACYEG